MFRHDRIMLKSRLIRIMCIPKMNLPVPPFEKGGPRGDFIQATTKVRAFNPPARLLQRGVNFLGNRFIMGENLNVSCRTYADNQYQWI